MGKAFPQHLAALMVLCVTGLALIVVQQLQFDGDLAALIADDDPVKLDYQRHNAPFAKRLFVLCPRDANVEWQTLSQIGGVESVSAPIPSLDQQLKLAYLKLNGDVDDLNRATLVVNRIEQQLVQMPAGCGLTGSAAYLVQSHTRQQADLATAGLVALLLILFLFIVLLRAGLIAVLALVPIVIGSLWGLALFALYKPTLSLLAATVPTLVFGVGLDHVIHQLQAARFAMTTGQSKNAAIQRASQTVRKPILISSLTTSGVFAALGFAELPGLADFGLAGAAVNLGVGTACLLLTPWLLRRCPIRLLERQAHGQGGFRLLSRLLQRYSWRWTIALATITLLSLLIGSQLKIMQDQRQLEDPRIPARHWQQVLSESFQVAPAPLLLITEQPLPATMRATLPPQFPIRLKLLPGTGATQFEVQTQLDLFQTASYRQITEQLSQWLHQQEIHRFVFTGSPALNARLGEALAGDAPTVMLAALSVLSIGLFVLNRLRLDSLAMLLPLLLGISWTGAWMVLSHNALSLISAAVAPLILGMGIDDGVHMICSWRRHDGNLLAIYQETGTALLLTTLTTVAAFMAFTLSESPALVMLGQQASVALLFCLVATLVALPLVLKRSQPDAD
jgi:predicted RND superfamily exporter protein